MFRFECIDQSKNCNKFFEIEFIVVEEDKEQGTPAHMVIQKRHAQIGLENEPYEHDYAGAVEEGYARLIKLRDHVRKYNYVPVNEPAKAFAETGGWTDWKPTT